MDENVSFWLTVSILSLPHVTVNMTRCGSNLIQQSVATMTFSSSALVCAMATFAAAQNTSWDGSFSVMQTPINVGGFHAGCKGAGGLINVALRGCSGTYTSTVTGNSKVWRPSDNIYCSQQTSAFVTNTTNLPTGCSCYLTIVFEEADANGQYNTLKGTEVCGSAGGPQCVDTPYQCSYTLSGTRSDSTKDV